MPERSFDSMMMANALRMGCRGVGLTAPNPSVGAVIANEATGEIIARGWTQPGGRPHAETEALRQAGDRARGATMYVTLEPCAHHGQTPPCADAIIAARLKRVVIGTGDRDPRTAGQGVARLRAAGLEVAVGVLEEDARWLALGHTLCRTAARPFVQLKMALSASGDIARGQHGAPVWVTSAASRDQGHLLRARADAILVGSATIRDDNPQLTCRLPGLGDRSPRCVVLSRSLSIDPGSRIFSQPRRDRVLVYGGRGADEGCREALQSIEAEVVLVDEGAGGVAIDGVLRDLAGRGVTRLLVEGGPAIWRAFAQAQRCDEIVVFLAEAGNSRKAAAHLTELVERYAPCQPMALADCRQIGQDVMATLRRK